MNGVDGTIFRGPNGHSIFIPKAGWINGTNKNTSRYWYWSSSVHPGHYNSVYSYTGDDNFADNRDDRPSGGTIRPVYVK